jgi:hypothetical protein
VKAPADGRLSTIATTASDVLVSVEDEGVETLYRRTKADWVKDSDIRFQQVRAGGSAVWALGFSADESIVAVRAADGKWTKKSPGADAGADTTFTGVWVSPQGDPFLFTDSTILRGTNGGAKWTEDDMMVAGAIKAIWGRSSSDVYVASFSRLLHFDGKTWGSTSYVGKTAALSGTAKEVFVVRADE